MINTKTNPMIFQASSMLLWLHRPICVGPGRKPEDRFSPVAVHIILNKINEIAIDQLKEVGGLNCKFSKPFKQQSITFGRDVIKLMAFGIQSLNFIKQAFFDKSNFIGDALHIRKCPQNK